MKNYPERDDFCKTFMPGVCDHYQFFIDHGCDPLFWTQEQVARAMQSVSNGVTMLHLFRNKDGEKNAFDGSIIMEMHHMTAESSYQNKKGDVCDYGVFDDLIPVGTEPIYALIQAVQKKYGVMLRPQDITITDQKEVPTYCHGVIEVMTYYRAQISGFVETVD